MITLYRKGYIYPMSFCFSIFYRNGNTSIKTKPICIFVNFTIVKSRRAMYKF